MILHGVYDNGKIDIIEKIIPDIKTEVEIKFLNNKLITKKIIWDGLERIIENNLVEISKKDWTRDSLYDR